MRRFQLWFVCVLAALAGCSTTPKYTLLTADAGSAPPQPAAPAQPQPKPVAPPAAAKPAVVTEPGQNGDGWVELGNWCRVTGQAKLTQIPGKQPRYQMENGAGRIEFSIGSQLARWNGVTFMLGYMPRLSNFHPVVHHLDLEKSFLPLLDRCSCLALTNKVIVIDPGHGGDQAGTRSVAGKHDEKEYTLDWALRLRPLLAARGWRVFLTRTNDVDISLADRVALAERQAAGLFISLHFNSAGSEQSGLETYCVTPAGLPSNLTRDYPDDPARVSPNNAFDTNSFCLAMRLHQSVLRTTPATDRGVRRARFMTVLRGQNRPAALIEGGYLSNRKEAALIATGEYRQKLAEAVARALP